jgi:chromosome segregation ATPase
MNDTDSHAEARDLRPFLEEQFATIRAHLLRHDQRFDAVDRRLDGVDRRLDGVDQRLAGVEAQLDRIQGALEGQALKLLALEAQIEAVRDDLKADMRELRGMLEGFTGKYEALHQEYLATRAGLRRVETTQDSQRQELERRLALLEGNVASLKARVEALEERRGR